MKFNQLPEFVAFLKRHNLTEITTPKQEKNGTIHIAFLGKKKAGAGCFTPPSHPGFTIHSNGYVRNVKGLSSVIKKYAEIKTEKQFLVAIEMLENLIIKRDKNKAQFKSDSLDAKSLFDKIKKDLSKIVRKHSNKKDYATNELQGKNIKIYISKHNSLRSKKDGYQIEVEIKKINKNTVSGIFYSPRADSRLHGKFSAPLGAIPQEIERIVVNMKKTFVEINKEAVIVEKIARRKFAKMKLKVNKTGSNYFALSQKVSEIARKEGFSEHVGNQAMRRLGID